MNSRNEEIRPGSWLGVFGGGQLGRMFTQAAQSLGYHVAVFEPEVGCPAAQVADRHLCPRADGTDTVGLVTELSQLCSAITLEFENIDSSLVRQAAHTTRVHPGAEFLEICQDRILEKSSLSAAGFPTTPFMAVRSCEEVKSAASTLGWPLVLKTVQSGYDGKGQAIVRSPQHATKVWDELGTTQVIAEKRIEFDAEVSMITARNARGEIYSYPLLENVHSNHILDVTRCPASKACQRFEAQAQHICRGVAEHFAVIGLFCVEFFITTTGDLLINEIAPRPHNSGHLTIEAFTCSQFEQQVRAICNLPLVPPTLVRPAAMANLLGDVWDGGEPRWDAALSTPCAHLHLYGKAEPRPGRKMGHLTVLDESASEAAITVRELRDALKG